MAVNLATKYAKQFAAAFAPTSYFKGKVSEAYKFDGVKKIVIQIPLTTPLTDYVRTGVDRYGTPTEMDTVDGGFGGQLDERADQADCDARD